MASRPDRTRDLVLPCAGVPIRAVTRERAAAVVVELAGTVRSAPAGADVHLCNAYTLALADRDDDLRALLRAAAVNFPDGKSVTLVNRLRDRAAPTQRVYGPDLFLDVLDRGRDAGLRHYLLGSTPDVLAAMERSLAERLPGLQVVGSHSPPFGETTAEERADQVRRIAATDAHVVWVGLGTPKQDVECAALAALHPAVFVAVGAAFDFVAGTKRQAPAWVGDWGLEWLFRLLTEPRRLWRRYLFGNARYLKAVVTRWREG